jgi:hypothetical protein
VAIHLCGAGTAFLGFSMSLIIGLYAQNPYTTIILRALTVMVLFYILGSVLAYIGQKVIMENFDAEVVAMDAHEQLPKESSKQADAETHARDNLTTATAT